MKHTPRVYIVRTDEDHWVAVCYECGWRGDHACSYTTATINRNVHEREAKR